MEFLGGFVGVAQDSGDARPAARDRLGGAGGGGILLIDSESPAAAHPIAVGRCANLYHDTRSPRIVHEPSHGRVSPLASRMAA